MRWPLVRPAAATGWIVAGLLVLGSHALFAQQEPATDGNRRLVLSGTAITEPEEITALLGIELPDEDDLHYVVIRLNAEPQTPEGARIRLDDFTLIVRNNGERSWALEPDDIFGQADLILTREGPVRAGGVGIGLGSQAPPGVYGPQDTRRPSRSPASQVPAGASQPAVVIGAGGDPEEASGQSQARIEQSGSGEDPRRAALAAQIFTEETITEPTSGLLYFELESEPKSKNLGLVYAGDAGRLVLDFN